MTSPGSKSVSGIQNADKHTSAKDIYKTGGKKESSSKFQSKETELTKRLEKCYEKRKRRDLPPCSPVPQWQNAKYQRDECGSGLIPITTTYRQNHKLWCRTPLSSYQATIGEFGRKLLCGEEHVPRDIRGGPPCNICEYILRPCRGYYRKYDCIRPCEEQHTIMKDQSIRYRDAAARYWDPCQQIEKPLVNLLAPHNVSLGLKLVREHYGNNCW